MQHKTLLLATLLIASVACSDDGVLESTGDDSAAASTRPGTAGDTATATTTGPDVTSDGDRAPGQRTVPTTADAATPPPEPIETTNAIAPVAPGSTTQMTDLPPPTARPLYDVGDIDSGLRPFIDQAIGDLAARLGVASEAISVRSAVLVVWPDSSLGCPQPGMSYAQANVDGSIIELEHDGDVYRYHTGGLRGPFICDQPIDKRPPTELLPLDDQVTDGNTGDDD